MERDFGTIVIVGDILLDRYIYGDVKRISPEAPVPVLLEKGNYYVGGGAANVAANAQSLGCAVHLIGVVGADQYAGEVRDFLEGKYRIPSDLLVTQEGWPTISKTRIVSGDQQIVRVDNEQVIQFSSATKQALLRHVESVLKDADILVISDYGKGVVDETVYRALIHHAHALGVPVLVDPKRTDFSFYRGASLLTPNRSELLKATAVPGQTEQEIIEAAQIAARQVGCSILVTRSEEGMTYVGRAGEIIHERAQQAQVFDVSGAGDTVVATLAAFLSSGASMSEAMRCATMAASIVVGRAGTSVVTRVEFEKVLRNDPLHAAMIVDAQEGQDIVAQWHRGGEKVVFTNGCFDLIHPGHIQLLREAARLGDRLIVGLNSDSSIQRLKGESRPLQNQNDRTAIMAAIRGVDMVILFDEDTPYKLIETLRPDILVKGADYRQEDVVGGDMVRARGGEVILVPILSGRSTTSLIKKGE